MTTEIQTSYPVTTVELGHCPVDSGQMMLSDPAYVFKELEQGEQEARYWEACRSHSVGCDHADDGDGRHVHSETGALIQDFGGPMHKGVGGEFLHFEHGLAAAVVSSTGWGDGLYPVTAEVIDFGEDGGSRVASVTITFIDMEAGE